jgi:hypothetical protein
VIDSKSVVQEVQKELLAVMQRGQEQVRKGQDRVRKSQEQARKSREAVVSVVRAGSELAKAVRPSAPSMPPVRIPSRAAVRAHAQELAGQAITAQRDLAAKAIHAAGPYADRLLTAQRELADRARHTAGPYAEHVATAQRGLAERVVEVAKVATPIVTEGRTRLTQLVSVLQSTARGADETPLDVASAPTATAEPKAHQAAPEAETPAMPKARTRKPAAAKTSTAKTSTAKTSTAKTSTAKTSTAKTSTAKTSTARTSTAKAAGTKPRSTPKK